MHWRDRLGARLVSLEAAVSRVESGQTVAVSPFTCSPMTLCKGLADRGRRGGLENVRIDHLASAFCWTDPELEGVFRLRDNYATVANRAACHAGRSDYLPIGLYRSYELPDGLDQTPDVFLVPVSPPDARGMCSFGPGVWMSPTTARAAKLVIAEVQEDFIRTGGENYIHMDEVDLFVEGEAPVGGPALPPPSEEEISQVEAICTSVAVELINDGDTLQMGVGTVSASLAQFLDFRNDLGIQTELVTGGIADLVERGNVTGLRKEIHRGKVVGSALVSMQHDELQKIHENPAFELYDFGHTDDLRRLIQLDSFVAVEVALGGVACSRDRCPGARPEQKLGRVRIDRELTAHRLEQRAAGLVGICRSMLDEDVFELLQAAQLGEHGSWCLILEVGSHRGPYDLGEAVGQPELFGVDGAVAVVLFPQNLAEQFVAVLEVLVDQRHRHAGNIGECCEREARQTLLRQKLVSRVHDLSTSGIGRHPSPLCFHS